MASPKSIREIPPPGSQHPGAHAGSALRRRSSLLGGAEPRCRPRGICMKENEKGTKPPSDRTLRKETARTSRTRRPRETRRPSRSDKGPEPGVSKQGRKMAPRAGARCHGPHLRLPGGFALLPPRPEPGPLLRLTVPSRAHELVQQGPHLRLGGHGGQWGRPGSSSQLNERSGKQRGRKTLLSA